MGIRHLFTYMNQINAVHEINMQKEVDRYKRNHNNEKPIIIIDLVTIHYLVYTNDKEKIMGGRYNIYNERADKMFKTITNMGCEIICVTDGQLFPDKIPTIIKRRNENYENNLKILHDIDEGLDISNEEILEQYKLSNLTPFFQNLRNIAKKYGELVRTIREADQEIVWIANKKNALAVISNDSDFFIFEGNWYCWSANDIDLEKLTTLEFDRSRLRTHLSLSSQQLILLATIAGNDFLSYDNVEHFHKQISRPHRKFETIANIVRRIHSLPPNLRQQDETYLINMMFGNRGDKETRLIDFRKSIKFYCDADFERPRIESTLLEVTSGQVFVHAILADLPTIYTMLYFDLSTNEFIPYYQLVRPCVQKQMGILLNHEPNRDSITRTIIVKPSHLESYKVSDEFPVFPEDTLPPIIELLTTPYGDNQGLDILRIKLLVWQISPNSILSPEIISKLPDEFLLTILIIFILVERNQISIDEADCLLYATVCDESYKQNLNLDYVQKIDGRGARISFLFTRLFVLIGECFSVLGLEVYANYPVMFDGLHYHYLRKNWKNIVLTTLIELKEKFKHLRIYAKDFKLID